MVDPERVRSRAHDLVRTSEEFLGASWSAAASGGRAPIDLGPAPPTAARRRPRARRGRRRAVVGHQPVRPPTPSCRATPRSRRARRAEGTAATSSAPSPTCAAGCADGWRVVAGHPGHGPAQRMVEVLARARRRRPAQPRTPSRSRAASCTVTAGTLAHGFVARPLRPGPGDRRRPVRAARGHPRHEPDAAAPQAADRPAGAQGRRLRRPRAARRRPASSRWCTRKVQGASASTSCSSTRRRRQGSTSRPTASTR